MLNMRTTARCTVCQSEAPSSLVMTKPRKHHLGPPISLLQCRHCCCVFLDSPPLAFDPSLYAYYDSFEGLDKSILFSSISRLRYIRLLEWIGARSGGRRLLDVGCGVGDFVDAASSVGWDALGIEMSAVAVNVATKLGIPIKELDFYSEKIAPSSYDVVTMLEVIEHVPDPGSFLERAERVLKPGGLLYITTPNFSSLDRKVLGANWDAIHEEHLTYFTSDTLIQLIRRQTHFRVVHRETRNISSVWFAKRKVGGDQCEPGTQRGLTDESVEATRALLDSSTPLAIAKRAVNALLNLTNLGATIVLLLQRPNATR